MMSDHHYQSDGLLERLLEALESSGKSSDKLRVEDLYPVDQLHMGGRQATMALADRLNLQPDTRVLDLGSGLGGTARLLASEYHCRVTALDITPAFCRAAEVLNKLTGLDKRITTVLGDACRSELPDQCFDLIWCQHTQMNIADKARLVDEFRRLLRPGGHLALHEVFAGPGDQHSLKLPVPWASSPEESHLWGYDRIHRLLIEHGFREEYAEACSESALAWWQALLGRIKKRPQGGLGPGLIFGDQGRLFGPNVIDNLQHKRIVVHELIMRLDSSSDN